MAMAAVSGLFHEPLSASFLLKPSFAMVSTSPTNPPQQVQTRCQTSWDPYNQPPLQYHHQDENQLSYGYGSTPAYQREPYRQPHQSTCWDLPRQPIQDPYDQPALFKQHELQNSNYVGPSSTTYQQPHAYPGTATRTSAIRQPPAHRVSSWEPSLTATVAANQPHQHYQHPRSDCPLQQPSPAPPVIAPLLASPPCPQAVVSCLMTNEWETNQHEGEERMEIQGLVDKHKEAFETTKQDMEVEIDGKRRLFEDELQLKIEVVTTYERRCFSICIYWR